MKHLNFNANRSSFFLKGITVVSLSLVLQGKVACSQGGTAGHKATKMDLETFEKEIRNQRDISLPDEKGRNQLYAAVKYNQPEKVSIILDQYEKDMASNLQHNHPNFINAPDPISNHTPLGEAIIQGHSQIVDIFIKSKHIDINQATNSRTSLVLALKTKQRLITNTLLNQPSIDIKTQAPNSGNTALHWAIQNNWPDIAKKLIDLLNIQAPNLLFAQNNKGDTPLHSAMQYKLEAVQAELIKLASKDEDKLWIKNNKGETAVDVAIRHNQSKGIALLEQAPIDKLYQKNTDNETLLHIAARLNLPNALTTILKRISTLAGKEAVVKQLFEKTKKGKSVWECIYLSQIGTKPIHDTVNIKMFKDTIEFVKDKLTTNDSNAILEGIKRREGTNRLQGGISKDYAYKLRNTVNNAIPAAADA